MLKCVYKLFADLGVFVHIVFVIFHDTVMECRLILPSGISCHFIKIVVCPDDGEIVVKHMFSNADVQGAHQHIVFIIIFMIGRCILFLEGIDYVLVLAHLLKAS